MPPVDKKLINGPIREDRQAITVQQMIADPEPKDLQVLGNSIDYFNLYKNKMQQLAKVRFERDKDIMFFNYLDRLVDPQKFEEEDRERAAAKGKQVDNLTEFVTGDKSLTQEKKRNEQVKRWEMYRKQRAEQGLPEYAETPNSEYLRDYLEHYKAKAVVRQKAFRP